MYFLLVKFIMTQNDEKTDTFSTFSMKQQPKKKKLRKLFH